MKRFRLSLFFVAITIITLSLAIGGPVSGQPGQPDEDGEESPGGAPAAPNFIEGEETPPPPPERIDSPNDPEDRYGVTGELVIVDDIIQVQGRLTDETGVALNGSFSIRAALYDVSSGGTARCSDTDTVAVDNGLFTLNMDFCTLDDINGDRLYLGIKVGTDAEMTPRQVIYPVPYAMALRPGAIIKGADSYIFTPGNILIKNQSSDTTRWDIQPNGAARVRRGSTAGNKTIYLPITLPAVLYGQNATLESITIYYRCQNSTNGYITTTALNLQTDAISSVNLLNDTTNRTAIVASSYTLSPTSNNALSSSRGAIGLYLTLSFANDTDFIDIGGVRVRLSHQ